MSIAPPDWTAFRQDADAVADWIAEYRRSLADRPVMSRLSPGDCAVKLPATAPATPEPLASILKDMDDLVVPGLTHWNHPGFHAYFNSASHPAGVLGEFASAAINTQAMLWRTSPVATELEIRVLEWLRDFVGLPADFTGVIQDTASTSTFVALVAARERALPGTRLTGLSVATNRGEPTLYVSEHAHSSLDKAAIATGIGLNHVRRIPVDDEFGMDATALDDELTRAAREGRVPLMVCATIGTTSVGSVDPAAQIASVCAKHGVWLHVDAAWAGTVAALPEKRELFAGWEQADSIVINPHKGLLTPMDFSALLFRDPETFRESLAVVPEYLQSWDQATNLMDYGLALGRRFRALKLWFIFRRVGTEGLRAGLREHCRLAQLLAGQLDADPMFEVVAPVHFGLVCFRTKSPDPHMVEDDEWNRRLLARINERGRLFLSHTVIDDRYVIRFAIGGLEPSEARVALALDELRHAARTLIEPPQTRSNR